MHRILFDFGKFKIYSFGVLVLIAFVAAFLFARKRGPRYGFTVAEIADASFWTLLLGILGARIGFIVQDLPFFIKHPGELVSIQFQGLTSFGGLIFGGLYLAWFAKRRSKSVWALLDVAGPPMLLAHAIGRVGCLLNGCCHGGQCTYPWGVHVEGMPGLWHPAQVYDSLMTLAALGILLLIERRGLKVGQSFALSILFYGVVRFIYEFWRAGISSSYLDSLPITDAQLMALAMAVFAAILFFRFANPEPAAADAEGAAKA